MIKSLMKLWHSESFLSPILTLKTSIGGKLFLNENLKKKHFFHKLTIWWSHAKSGFAAPPQKTTKNQSKSTSITLSSLCGRFSHNQQLANSSALKSQISILFHA